MHRIISIIAILLLLGTNSWAENDKTDKDRQARKDNKEERIRNRWNDLVPKQNKLQFAGSMGMFSGSIGWYYGKKNQWETDVFLGFIPKSKSQNLHVTFTVKETFTPWRKSINDNLEFEPLTTGIYINKIFGEYFWNKLPKKYPNGYYFWAVNTRFNIFIGQTLTFKLKKTSLSGKELSLYYELSTNDLYLISAVGNRSISAFDIMGLSLGIRYRMF